ncbi:hypothetical protein B0O99DRAFT_633526 [Bisporella sp. PMI_857]|nr:hypothetical protein B0O99DRAFT_633526 [Bisporella sp. PMI_857]
MASPNTFTIPRRPVSGLATSSQSTIKQRQDSISVNHLISADIHNVSSYSDPSIRLLQSPDGNFCTKAVGDPAPSKELVSLDRLASPSPPRNKIKHKEQNGIYWRSPIIAVVLFVVGVLAAAGHHVFLSRLNEKPNNNQKWIGRYSLVLAFVVKMSFAATVAEALKQRIWYSFRRNQRGISVTGIDAILAIQQTPFGFLNFEIWQSATLALVLGGVIWALPLLAVVTPTSLTTSLKIVNVSEPCVVPNFEFFTSEMSNSRTTLQPGASLSEQSGTDSIQFATPLASKLATSTAYNGRISGWPSPCGSNCSYVLQFFGPAWQCHNVDNSSSDAAFTLGSDPWGDSWQNWRHGYSYLSNFSSDSGYLWVGTSTIRNLSSTGLETNYFYCQDWNTSYQLAIEYTNNQLSIKGTTFRYLNEVKIPGILETGISSGQGTIPITYPEGQDRMQTYAYAALFRSLGSLLLGNIQRQPHGKPVYSTSITLIPGLVVFDSDTYTPISDLFIGVEELSRNLTISLLSNPNIIGSINSTVDCTTQFYRTAWEYDYRILMWPYIAAIVICIACLGIGCQALLMNEVAYDISFSTIMRTTRGQVIDSLVNRGEGGELPVPAGIGEAKLRFSNKSRESEEFDEGVTHFSRGSFVVVLD